MWPTPRPNSSPLASSIISAEGMLTQYRETLRALIGADAQSMPAIHPVALPALQETLPPSLSFELLARRPDLQALRGYVTASLSQVDAAKRPLIPILISKRSGAITPERRGSV